MKHPWFKAIGLLYVPVSPAGRIATLLAVAWCAHVSGVVDVGSHSVSDASYGATWFRRCRACTSSRCGPAGPTD